MLARFRWKILFFDSMGQEKTLHRKGYHSSIGSNGKILKLRITGGFERQEAVR